jgi:hypothetical protein
MEHLGLVGLLSVSALSAMLTACAGGSSGATALATRGVVVTSATTSATRANAARDVPAGELGLQPGDFVVYRFSGTFRKAAAPLMLTQRVLARDGGVVALEVTLEDGAKQETLRIRKDATPGSAEEVLDVTRIEAGIAHAATVDAYAALMTKTVVAADENEGELGAEETTVRLGGRTLRCKKTSYRVRVGKHEATMRTVESNAFPWGDVGGDITTADGQVLYRVEVMDAGSERDRSAGSVAAAR